MPDRCGPRADEGALPRRVRGPAPAQGPLGSRDGRVALPGCACLPHLGLTVSFRPAHARRLDWSVRYARTGVVDRFAAGRAHRLGRVRDPAAERRLLAGLPLPVHQLPRLADAEGPYGIAAHVVLAGLEAASFVDAVLPGLEHAGVEVARTGEVLGYRRPRRDARGRGDRPGAGRHRRLVRPARRVSRRGRARAVRPALRRAEPGRGPPDARQRGLLQPQPAGIRPAARPDRGVASAAGARPRAAEHQPVPEQSLGGPGRPGCRRSSRRPDGSGPSPHCGRPADVDPTTPPAALRPSCGRTSGRATPGCARSGRPGWAGSWPTTWGWARPCRPLPCSRDRRARRSGASVPGGRPDQRGLGLGHEPPRSRLGCGWSPWPVSGAASRRGGRAGGRRRRGGDLVRAAAAGRRGRVRRGRLVGAGAGRGSVREEPPRQGAPGAAGSHAPGSSWPSRGPRWRTA